MQQENPDRLVRIPRQKLIPHIIKFGSTILNKIQQWIPSQQTVFDTSLLIGIYAFSTLQAMKLTSYISNMDKFITFVPTASMLEKLKSVGIDLNWNKFLTVGETINKKNPESVKLLQGSLFIISAFILLNVLTTYTYNKLNTQNLVNAFKSIGTYALGSFALTFIIFMNMNTVNAALLQLSR